MPSGLNSAERGARRASKYLNPPPGRLQEARLWIAPAGAIDFSSQETAALPPPLRPARAAFRWRQLAALARVTAANTASQPWAICRKFLRDKKDCSSTAESRPLHLDSQGSRPGRIVAYPFFFSACLLCGRLRSRLPMERKISRETANSPGDLTGSEHALVAKRRTSAGLLGTCHASSRKARNRRRTA